MRGKKTEVERPYLPGYIFIRFDVLEDRWQPIHYTRGIKELIRATPERPIPIADKAMSILLDRCDGQYVRQEVVDACLNKLIPLGSTVRLTEGPFANFEGPVKWTSHDRVRVLINVFGRDVIAKMKTSNVELIGAGG